MSDGVTLAQEASSRDPAVGLRAVRALRELAERLEALQVASARDQGWSWQEIAVCLGVSRQAVHKKHGRNEHGQNKQGGGRRLLRKEQ
ncbi:helix-turn-helix domain-containing protein [Actinomadura sp. 7K507]|uniref:helix-turn-helix domain-containing protein n=1 Tax=Actinomadura sp. 7K507 TaxID=2530365 RepID=UPI00104A82BE|nr:helix-turn-helix domain-containing protein [Actinomadura sp. 7K507]TDC81117.1 RNA polymerase subunit sigma-70 [Actinomadura sp. 7K507]